jgi:hypothetical protein
MNQFINIFCLLGVVIAIANTLYGVNNWFARLGTTLILLGYAHIWAERINQGW